MGYLIALNCGSSSIKGKLFELSDEKGGPMEEAGALSVSNIGAKGEQIKVKVKWFGGRGDDVEVEKGDGADVQRGCTANLRRRVLTIQTRTSFLSCSITWWGPAD